MAILATAATRSETLCSLNSFVTKLRWWRATTTLLFMLALPLAAQAEYNWTVMPKKVTDIAGGPDGSIWAIGNSEYPPNSGIFRWNGSGWNEVGGAAVRIAVDPQGRPWVVNAGGNIFRRNLNNNSWDLLPGSASDIGIGDDGSAWIIGTNAYPPGGNGIFRWSGSEWREVGGAAVHVAVDPQGRAWVVNSGGAIFRFNFESSGWDHIPGGAINIGKGGPSGSIFIVGLDGKIKSYNEASTDWHEDYPWFVLNATQPWGIVVDHLGRPWVFMTAGNLEPGFNQYLGYNQVDRSNWMAEMRDERLLSELVIPGTHDSGSYDQMGGGDIGETQDWNISQQLENGIRFLDVRISNAHFSNYYPFEIRHGFTFLGNFQTLVLNPVNDFLASHPGEVVIMSVKDEGDLDKVRFMNEVVNRTVNNERVSRFVSEASSRTTLGEVRGKIVLVNRMGVAGGIAWNDSSLKIQDYYDLDQNCEIEINWEELSQGLECSLDYPKKARHVLDHIAAARADLDYHFWINFASANYEGFWIGNNAEVANRALKDRFNELTQQAASGSQILAFGSIIPMDYPNRQGDQVITSILRFNQVARSRGALMTELDCSQESTSASLGGGPPSEVTMINVAGSPSVRIIYWLDFQGSRIFWAALAKGQQAGILTGAGHSWVITDASSHCTRILVVGPHTKQRGYLR